MIKNKRKGEKIRMKEKEVSKFVKEKKHVTKREFIVKQRGITLIALVITIVLNCYCVAMA